jgi:hypothetical protein
MTYQIRIAERIGPFISVALDGLAVTRLSPYTDLTIVSCEPLDVVCLTRRLLGGAGLIVAYPHSAAGKVEPAVTRAVQKAVGEAEGHHVQALKAAIADAQQKLAEAGS